MNFALDDEQELIAQTVRRFAERDVRGWAAEADRSGKPPARLPDVAGDLGFYVDAVPASADGALEGPYSHTTRALRGFELGRGCAAIAAILESNVEPALAVGAWGSDAAKKDLFGALAGGGLAVFAHDARGAWTVDGDRITGTIGPLPVLGAATHVVISTTGLVALIEVDSPQQIVPSGWRAAHWGTLTLDAHRIPDEFVLARGDAAAVVSAQIRAWANVSLAARAAGVATAAMEYATQYGTERVQFGQPIGTFESLIRLRDDAQTQAHAAKLVALHAAWALDTNAPNAIDAASRARVIANDTVTKATIDAVQCFGGYGFVNDYPVEKLMRDARAFEALYGDERLARVLAAKAG